MWFLKPQLMTIIAKTVITEYGFGIKKNKK